MVNVGKREDGLLDTVLEYQARIQSANRQIDLWILTRPEMKAALEDIRESLTAHDRIAG